MIYILLTPSIGQIGGAQVYCRNKIKFCQDKGWKTYLFYDTQRKILIKELEPFANNLIKELALPPYYYTRKKKEEILEKIIKDVGYKENEEVIIESHYFAESMWAELIASKCHGRNIVFLLCETFEGFHKESLGFFEFKYQRRELACISKKVMQRLFDSLYSLELDECYALRAACANSVENIRIPSEFENIGKHKVIGIIGRLQKLYVEIAVCGIAKFLEKYPNEKFEVLIIGGSEKKEDENNIRNILNKYSNCEVYITGNMYPIPKKLVQKMAVCIGGAGCARISNRENVPTIVIDAIKGKAMGVFDYNTRNTVASTEKDELKPVEVYLEDILFNNFLNTHERILTMDASEQNANDLLNEHVVFLQNAEKHKNYYLQFQMPHNYKELIKKLICSYVGIDLVFKISNLLKR